MEGQHFWLVWTPGTVPTYQHESHASALAECQRLASVDKTKRFYVLKALRYAEYQAPVVPPPPPNVNTVELVPPGQKPPNAPGLVDDMPF